MDDVTALPVTDKRRLMAAFDEWVTDPAITLANAPPSPTIPAGSAGRYRPGRPCPRPRGRPAHLPRGRRGTGHAGPAAAGHAAGDGAGLELFQIVQAGPATLRLRLHPAPGADPDTVWHTVEARLSELLIRHRLGHVRLERTAPAQRGRQGARRRPGPRG
ncbi:hypothetical protein [Nonomuraea aridisoli]|uniref:hypothetical protein n=1 Tax=Nonomuraea aridisoli TaxID=2070368 RepID=UPI0011B94006|nr:hypothetical protein [Nonomuraea aridisoli]